MKKTMLLYKKHIDNLSNFRLKDPYFHQVLIGQMLADGNLVRRSPTRNTYFRVGFGQPYQAYANWILQYLKDHSNKGVTKRKDHGYDRYDIVTRVNPLFNYYYVLFYPYNEALDRYVKIVPKNIASMMTPVVLAHMAIGDGTRIGNKLGLCTHGFLYEECILLANRIRKIGLTTRVVFRRVGSKGQNQYKVEVGNTQELSKLRAMLMPHMFEGMYYKLGIGKKEIPIYKNKAIWYNFMCDNMLLSPTDR